MKLQVKPLKGDTFEVDYEPDTKVKELKEIIEKAKPEMPAAQLKLIYSGKILVDDSPMQEYGIKEGEFVVVMVQKAKPPAAAPADAAAPAPAPAAAPTPAVAPSPAPAPEGPAAGAPGGDAAMLAASAMPGMESTIANLCDMGFERPQVERCLRAAFGNPDRAVEYLMSGIPDGIGEDAPAAPPAPGGGGAPPGGGGGGAAPFPAMGGAFPAMPTGGGGGGGGAGAPLPPALAELRNSPQFAQLAQLVATNPQMLQQMLPALAASNPAAAQAVQENPEAFIRMLQEAGAGGAGGGGGGGGMGGMGGGAMPGGMPAGMGAQMAQLAQNPAMLQQIVSEIAQSDPELAAQIQADPEAFARTMQAMAAGGMPGMGGGGGGGGGGEGGPQVVRLTEEEGQAVQRLVDLTGMDRQRAAQAYLASDKNEELAANLLFDGFGAMDD